MPEDERMITACIHKLTRSKIKSMIENAVSGSDDKSKLLGKLSFEQISKALQFLSRCTKGLKCDIFRKPK
jgi:hypothetical protein